MEPGLSASCYGGRPDATRRGTDRRAALVRFRSLVRDGGLPWVAKLDIASFFDAIPHAPLLAALRRPLANVFLTAFDRSLKRAGIVFLRYLDDVTILAASPAALAAGLGTAKSLLESLGMSLRAEKTQAAWLGGGEPPLSRLELPGRNHELAMAGEIDFLGSNSWARSGFGRGRPMVNRLLRKIRTAIVAGRSSGQRGSGIFGPVVGSTSSSATSSPAGPPAAGSGTSAMCSPASTRCSATPS